MTTAATILSQRKPPSTETIEAEVLAAIFFDDRILAHLREGYQGESSLDPAHFTGRYTGRYAHAAWELASQHRPITVATILAQLGDRAEERDRQLLQRIDDRAVQTAVDALPTNVAAILRAANERLFDQMLLRAAREREARPYETVDIARQLQRQLTDITTARQRRRASSAGEIIATGAHKQTHVGVPLGLLALDDLGDPTQRRQRMMGGLGRGEKMILTGLYGGRKTSTAVYLTTQMMRPRRRLNPLTGEQEKIDPERVLYVMLDDSREVLINWYISQIATARLIADKAPQHEWFLSSRGNGPETFATARQMAALEWAERVVARLPLHIIDGADNAHAFEATVERIRDGCINDGVTTVVIDYMQDMVVKGVRGEDIRARMEAICMTLKPLFTDLGSKYGLKLIGLSQRPENVNAFGTQGDTAGLAGGGVLAQFANWVLQTRGFTDQPTVLEIKGLKMRAAARGVTFGYEIVPSNGFITNPEYMPPRSQLPSLPLLQHGEEEGVVIGEEIAAAVIDGADQA